MSKLNLFFIITTINILLYSNIAQCATISGKVFDGDSSNPIVLDGNERIAISVINKNDISNNYICTGWCSTTAYPSCSVDNSGSYTLYFSNPGEYYVKAHSYNGANYLTEWWSLPSSTRLRDNAQTIIINNEEDVISNINFNLDHGGTISGNIFKPDGVSLLDNQLLGIRIYNADDNTEAVDRMNIYVNNGKYKIVSVPTGQYYIQAFQYGIIDKNAITYTTEWWSTQQSTVDFSKAEKIFIKEGENLVDRDFQLDPLLRINGKVFYNDNVTPVRSDEKDVHILAYKNKCSRTDTNFEGILGLNGEEGQYSIMQLPPGTYYLKATPGNSTKFKPLWWNTSGGTTDCTLAEPIVVREDNNEFGKNFNIKFLSSFPWQVLLPSLIHK